MMPGIVSAVAVGSVLSYAAFADGKPTSHKGASSNSAFPDAMTVALDEKELAKVGERDEFVSAYRRLTESQYRNTIADIFGPEIELSARFEPEMRQDGLQAVGNADLSVTTTGLEQYFSLARSIAQQVMADERRDELVGCAIDGAMSKAQACAKEFFKETGKELYRRPLTGSEFDTVMSIWTSAAEGRENYRQAFELALVSMLVSPEFLFRTEVAERVGDTDKFRMDAYSKASRLSYFLWDTAPDEELIAAAERGDLHTSEDLIEQVDRMMGAERFDEGVRAFFTDMLFFEHFDTVTKDSQTYPKFSQAVANSAREETLRFLVQLLVENDGDYRDIFTSRETVINRSLAAVYNVPYPSREDWTSFEFSEDSQRSGVLTQVTFTSLFSHPGSSSPTLRGKHIAEIFQCTKIPDPPADVDFSKVQALEEGTVRERLDAHRSDPTCASCHILMDPAGLALENFDSIGQFRKLENGKPINVSADIFGQKYEGAPGIGQYLHDDPQTSACVVQKAYSYGVGRPYDYQDAGFVQTVQSQFEENGYKLKGLFRSILTDPKFYDVVVPDGLERAKTSAQIETQDVAQGGLK
tara:strand:+ start:31983 stop:33731 length:1749 start_codon:yes stop_codon:yes gene_type:complete